MQAGEEGRALPPFPSLSKVSPRDDTLRKVSQSLEAKTSIEWGTRGVRPSNLGAPCQAQLPDIRQDGPLHRRASAIPADVDNNDIMGSKFGQRASNLVIRRKRYRWPQERKALPVLVSLHPEPVEPPDAPLFLCKQQQQEQQGEEQQKQRKGQHPGQEQEQDQQQQQQHSQNHRPQHHGTGGGEEDRCETKQSKQALAYVSERINSIPNIICTAASSELYMLPLGRVQKVLKRQILGEDGLRAAYLLHKSLLGSPTARLAQEYDAWEGGLPDCLALSPRQKLHLRAGRPSCGADSGGRGDMDAQAAEMDSFVQRRLAEFEKVIEYKRAVLLGLPLPASAAEEGQDLAAEQPQAEDVVQPVGDAEAPEGCEQSNSDSQLSLAADDSTTDAAADGSGIPQHAEQLTNSPAVQPKPASSTTCTADTLKAPRSALLWDSVKGHVEKHVEMWDGLNKKARNIARAQTKLIDKVSYRELKSLYQGRSQGNTAAGVYEARCIDLGVVPSTKVLEQMGEVNSNMSHCALGRRGMEALSHALAANQIIESLNVSDNKLDAEALTHLLRGILTGVGLRGGLDKMKVGKPIPGGQSPQRWAKLDQLACAVKPSFGSVLNAALPMLGGNKAKKPSRANIDANKTAMDRCHCKIHILDISGNPLGIRGALLLAQVVNPLINNYQVLTSLDISKCDIPDQGGMAIFQGLAGGNVKLHTLKLAHNGLSNSSAAALGSLLEYNHTLVYLDLSWNNFKVAGAQKIAEGLANNGMLKELSLAWNGLEDRGVEALGDMLQQNATLQTLDLSHTRAGSAACLVLGEALKVNHKLHTLLINGNMIGEDGARHLMLALARNSGLKHLGMQGSNTTKAVGNGGSAAATFNAAHPHGSYVLDLAVPTERSIALQLSSLNAEAPEELLKNIKHNFQPIRSAVLAGWPERLPTNGVMTCEYVSKRTRTYVKVIDQKKLEGFEAQFNKPTLTDAEKLEIVKTMAQYHYFTCWQAFTILRSFPVGQTIVDATAILFFRISDLEDNLQVMLEALTYRDQLELQKLIAWNYCFRASNPTGHFELALAHTPHHQLAGRLKDLSNEEADMLTWLNVNHELGQEIEKFGANYGVPDKWASIVPTRGTLSFDFVSSMEPPADCSMIGDAELVELLKEQVGIRFEANGSPVPPSPDKLMSDEVAALRQASAHMYCTCQQVRMILKCFGTEPDRVEVAVMMWSRVNNRKQDWWTVMYDLRPLEQAIATYRLGPQNIFNPKHPGLHWYLDCNHSTHEEVAKKLVDLAMTADTELPNWWNIMLNGREKTTPENPSMWALFTTETFTPILEFDFISRDLMETVSGRKPEELAALSKGDQLEMRTKHAARMKLNRARHMQSYFKDDSGYHKTAQEWRTHKGLMQSVMEKPSWVAGWDRQMRKLVRLTLRYGLLDASSVLEMLFNSLVAAENHMEVTELSVLLASAGYGSNDQTFYYKRFEELMEKNIAEGVAVPAGAAPGIRYRDFVELIMQEPPKRHKWQQAISDVEMLNFLNKLKGRTVDPKPGKGGKGKRK